MSETTKTLGTLGSTWDGTFTFSPLGGGADLNLLDDGTDHDADGGGEYRLIDAAGKRYSLTDAEPHAMLTPR